MIYVGIDPGIGGAVALWTPEGKALELHDMPVHTAQVGARKRRRVDVYQLALVLTRPGIVRVLIEDVHAMPRQGVSSTFAFGFATGAVHGAVGALRLPLRTITPAKWKAALGLGRSKDESRRLASGELPEYSHLWPLKKHDGRAEAALLALACSIDAGAMT